MSGALIWSVAASAILIYSGVQVEQALDQRAEAQTRVTRAMNDWANSFEQYADASKRWDAMMLSVKDIGDFVTLIDKINIAPLSWRAPDKLTVQSAKVDESIGSYRTCLASGNGVDFSLSSAQEAIGVIASFSNRHDMTIDGIHINRENQGVKMRFDNLCFIVNRPA